MNTLTLEMGAHYHARDAYIHANQKGNGSACRFELHPAHGDVAGSVFLQIAMQSTIGGYKGGIQVFPTFDWENKIVVKFDRTDLSQILQVLRGMKESAGDDKGLFHRTSRATTIIKFSHQMDPRPGYLLSISRKTADGALKNAWFVFDVDEAFTLQLSLERAMMYVCLGIPEVIERPRRQMPMMPQRIVQQPEAPVQIPAESESEEMLKASGDPF